jgi:hypothetical protein
MEYYLFYLFFKGLSLYFEGRIWIRIRIRIRVKIRIQIRIWICIRVISQIRIRIRICIKVMRIHNTGYNMNFYNVSKWLEK